MTAATAGTATVRVTRALRLSLRGGIDVLHEDGGLVLNSYFGAIRFPQLARGVTEALTLLAEGSATLDELSDRVLATDGAEQLHRLYFHVNELALRGLLQHTLVDGGVPVATLSGFSRYYKFEGLAIDPHRVYVLSRFAFLHRDGAELVLECPLGHARVILHDPRAAALVACLSGPRTLRELPAGEDVAAGLLLFLLNARAVTTPEDEAANVVQAQWNAHDLFFHSRSRYGRHENPFGATFRHAGNIEPLPAVKPRPRGETIELPRPDLAQLAATDPSLAATMERRHTMYEYGATPITFSQVGELLYRVARVRTTFDLPVPGHDDLALPASSRPYPAGGKSYDLELYLTVNACDGLAGGFYHYDPLEHRLTKIRDRDALVEAMVGFAKVAAPSIGEVQVLITLASRFQRVSWKYDSIAYATTLRHVGILYQSFYLAATAMGLAPCALGGGDADLFATVSGNDYLAEGSVGDFLIGSRMA